MPFTKYTKWDGVDWESLSLEDLLERLADFLLQSGFQTQYSRYWGEEEERTLEALRDAIMRALFHGPRIPTRSRRRRLGEPQACKQYER